MKARKIVITGGPGTGKSALIGSLETAGFYCFPEVIRSMTLEAKQHGDPQAFVSNPLAFVPDPYAFNLKILQARLDHFQQGSKLARQVVFYDRGLPDVLAYMEYFKQPYGNDFLATCRRYRYDEVLILPPWEAIYVSDNERLESFEEACAIHNQLKETYLSQGYEPREIPEGSLEERCSHIRTLLELS